MVALSCQQKSRPGILRRHEIFSSLNYDVFLCSTLYRDGELVWKDSDLLYEVSDQLLIIGEHLILCLFDGFSQSSNPFFVMLPFRLCGLNLFFFL